MANEVYSNTSVQENSRVAASPFATYEYASKKDTSDAFDVQYSAALELMGGDKLLKPASSINKVTIRKTSTQGLYKVILMKNDASFRIKYIDESELLNNKDYAMGTISKISDDKYEITYFDTEDEITIEHYDRAGAINFMKMNKLIFQT